MNIIKKIINYYYLNKYIDPIFYKIKTHMTKDELNSLFFLSLDLDNNSNCVEIGSYLGASSVFLASGTKLTKSKIYCIDTWKNDAMSEGSLNTYDDFLKNTINFKNNIIPIKGWSYNVIGKIKKMISKIDLLFIDGDHSYKGVKKDWDHYSPLLKKGGIVIFHDSGWADGVKKVINEDVLPKCRKYKQLPNLWWGWLS